MSIVIDVVLDLAFGDSGKGKISHKLLSSGQYNTCLRFNGGGNAGHTIIHEGKKFVTHLLPAGVFYKDVTSVIGPGCVVNPNKFFEELEMIETTLGKKTVKIAKNAHLVTPEHLAHDAKDAIIGTTKTGTGPAYSDKYARVGLRAESNEKLKPYLCDMFHHFYGFDEEFVEDFTILAEGAQSVNLDIDWGNYPYVTSSHCGIGGVLNNGFHHNHVHKVYGVIKGYDTYVGNFKFEPDEKVFRDIREAGQEFGATTGRPRQVNWIDLKRLRKSILMNGVTHLIINKMDVLDKVGKWAIISETGHLIKEKSEKSFKEQLFVFAEDVGIERQNVIFSSTADGSDIDLNLL